MTPKTEAQPDTALLDAIGSVQRSAQAYGPAPHKPILLLLALSRLQAGRPRLAPFSDYEQALRALLVEFVGNGENAAEPFWRLQNDGLWEVVRGDGSAVLARGESSGAPPMAVLREESVQGGLPEAVFELLMGDEQLFVAACQLLLEGLNEKVDAEQLMKELPLDLPDEEHLNYRDYALKRIQRATGQEPVAEEGGSQSYLLPSGSRFHLRTMRRHRRSSHWYSYWFGIKDVLWSPGEIFVFQCGLAGTLIVPAEDWLAFKDRIPLAKEGTSGENRQPQLWREGRKFEFRVADEPGKVTDEGKLDARVWLDRFDHLTTSRQAASGERRYWWVNQGQSYVNESAGGVLYASLKSQKGDSLFAHSNVAKLSPGDVVFHYAEGEVKAVSSVSRTAVQSSYPFSPAKDGAELGWLAKSTYFGLAEPIALSLIPQDLRIQENNDSPKPGSTVPIGL